MKTNKASDNYLRDFKCIRCGRDFLPEQIQYTCPACGGNLDARYDYEEIRKGISTTSLKSNREPSIWRFRPFLPLELADSPIPLKVGMTPLTRAPNLGRKLGLENLYIKNDGLNPSGSLKDRASFVVVANCLEENVKQICAASTGNAGTSLACLAASVQLETMIFVPETAPKAKMAQLLIYGAKVFAVRGTYTEAFELCEQVSRHLDWCNRNTGTNPYTREGKKTVSFEIWEQMGFRVPDFVIVSVGDGNIISGVYKGFFDLFETGFIDKFPRLVGVQSTGSASITDAFNGDGVIRSVEANTVADSISVTKPSDGEAALMAVEKTDGKMIAVEDDMILRATKSLAENEGVFAEPSGAACLAGLEKLLENDVIQPDHSIVLIVTGNGLKDVESALKVVGLPATVDPDLRAIVKLLDN